MVVIKTQCLPKMSEEDLRKLHNLLVAAVTTTPGFGVTSEKDMINLFPADMMQYGLGEEIVVEVIAYEVPGNNGARGYVLLRKLADAIRTMFPAAQISGICHPIAESDRMVARTFEPREKVAATG